jgi:hypothetical protein
MHCELLLMQSAKLLVEEFPSFSQMAFGGAPNRKLNWRKSASFETTQKSCMRAKSQINLSAADDSSCKLTWLDPGKSVEMRSRTRQEIFWSSRSLPLTLRRSAAVPDLRQMPDLREDHWPSTQGNLEGYQLRSCRMQDSPTHHRPQSAYRGCRVCLIFGLG